MDLETALDAEARVAMLCAQSILAGKIALGKTEIMNGIEEVCFAASVHAANPDQRRLEPEVLVEIILELVNLYGPEL